MKIKLNRKGLPKDYSRTAKPRNDMQRFDKTTIPSAYTTHLTDAMLNSNGIRPLRIMPRPRISS